ncbi:MAG: D-alanine--D-alanine ligase [Candidatus Latescibacteria bacterium]|jgi:D-alanine-D-alanine ligase|nr:D-alanine--D-alanine ligase [Candidatus Latescibacterota bacterium]
MKIAVFMGGSSPEREVSLNSGKEITKALKAKGHMVTPYDVEWRGKQNLFLAIEEVFNNATDVVFLAFHGDLGENGGIQGVLEAVGLPYTGSGITASAIAMDKDISKKLFTFNDVATAAWICGDRETIDTSLVERKTGYPCIVKPADSGSTVGLSLVNEPSELPSAIDIASKYSGMIMVESYISGCELTVPVLGSNALPVIEIRPSHKIYDYECKYTPGMTEYFVPAPITEELASELKSIAMKVFNILGLRDIARIDFRLDSNGRPLCFEANTLPGMTSTSLVPKSAQAAGIDFPELVTRIAEMAYQRRHQHK